MPSKNASSSPDHPAIRLLGDAVISGIAAGEVIQRPASAVKELVENALDAGAHSIEIRYDDAQRLDLSVADDGIGMIPEDLSMAVERHATSKLRSLDDLESIATFGFRGEALSSMAAVADVEIVSRTRESPEAAGVLVRDGRVVDQFAAGARVGTRVAIRNLFGNVPARRKFLKGATAEYTVVADVVRRFALLHPRVGYRLIRNGRPALDLPAVEDLSQRLRQVLDTSAAAALHPLDAAHAGMRLHGAMSGAGESFGSARRMFLFMNGRWVQDRLLFRAVMDGYRTYLMKGRYPAAALFLDVPGTRVDVNVHPAKLEVRFAEPDQVQGFVAEAIRETLRGVASPLGRWGLTESDLLQSQVAVGRRASSPTRAPRAGAATESVVGEGWEPIPGYVESPFDAPGRGAAQAWDEAIATRGSATGQDALGSEFVPSLRVLGQLFRGYILCERGGELVVIDQHAAHERIVYERLVARLAEGRVERQPLLTGLVVDVGGAAAEAMSAAHAELLAAGWEVERMGDEDVVVRAVPAICAGTDVRPLIERLGAELIRSDVATAGGALAREILATVACHTATRVGEALGDAEQAALVEQIRTADFAASCPHGRPVARVLPRARIERMFGR